MKALTVNIDTGSSSGYHYWLGWHHCPRQRYLDDLKLQLGIRRHAGNLNMMAGSVFHGYMQLFFQGKRTFDTAKVRFSQSRNKIWLPEESARKAGTDLFKSFRAKYKPDIFGQVLAIEKPYKVKKAPWLPPGMTLTATMDLETKILKKHAKKIAEEFGIELEPGIYIIDHKSAGGTRHINQYEWELQFDIYMMLKLLKTPKLKGFLVNMATKENPPKHKLIFRPLPDEDRREAAKAWLKKAYELSQERPTECRQHNCYNFGEAKPCIYGVTGECPRW